MDKESLELIINNKKAINALDRLLKDSGELHLICDKINRERDISNREDLIRKMGQKNKALAESIVNMAGVMTTLKYNPQSPMVQ
jgi:hypothetical protein